MSSTAISETSTLLPKPPSSDAADDSDADRPVEFEAFLKNVRVCKLLMALGLPICFGLEVVHLVLTLTGVREGWTALGKAFWVAGLSTDVVGLISIVQYPHTQTG